MSLRSSGDASASCIFPSGEWTGYWQQGNHRGAQDLRLSFRAGAVTGAGDDCVGAFTVSGHYDDVASEVTFWKRYVGQHEVWYRGFHDGIEGIWGTWEMQLAGVRERGGFHIRPLGHGRGVEVEATAEAEIPAAPQRCVTN